MKKYAPALLFALALATAANAQKKSLDHSVYDGWNNVVAPLISKDGQTVVYRIAPQRGDGVLTITRQGVSTRFERGDAPRFFGGEQWVRLTLRAPFDSTRQAKIKKVAKDKMPKDSTILFHLPTGGKQMFYASQASVCEEAPVAAMLCERERVDSAKRKTRETELLVIDCNTSDTLLRAAKVKRFAISDDGRRVVYLSARDSMEYLWAWRGAGEPVRVCESGKAGRFGQIVLESKKGGEFAYTLLADTVKSAQYELLRVAFSDLKPVKIEAAAPGITFSNAEPVTYSKNGGLLRFSLDTPPVVAPKDTLPADEKFSFDLWSTSDTLPQTQQLMMLQNNRAGSYRAVYFPGKNYWRLLTTSRFMSAAIPELRDDAPCYLCFDQSPYLRADMWEMSGKRDVTAYFPATDTRKPIVTAAQDRVSASPASRWVMWFDVRDGQWKSVDLKTGEARTLTDGLGVSFANQENDMPCPNPSFGISGWVRKPLSPKSKRPDYKELAIVSDRYDLWLLDPSGTEAPRRLTDGRPSQTGYAIVGLDPEEEYIDLTSAVLLQTFNEDTKNSGFARLTPAGSVETLVDGPYKYALRAKAKNADRVLWTRESFTEYPDLWYSGTDFAAPQKLTDANPQAKDYLWGSVQLVDWTDTNGRKIRGLLYLPEDYDPAKRYPTILYFYERSTDDMHRHTVPQPAWSIVIPPMYTSNGYAILMPDITFKVGEPGQSAYDAVVSGATAMVERGIADPKRLGLQGQSWGGYEIAYLVTKTDMFCCASPGAPVCNYTSAYTGIRLEAGITRMMQYEHGQSRMGTSLWENIPGYIANSPLFFLPDVNTPLLIRHSDLDEAVPFSQGLDMFLALKRLGKTAWLMEYDKEAHNLRTRPARVDWSIRMQQFFDHYMKDAPMPRWMSEGIPAREKGKELKYDLPQ